MLIGFSLKGEEEESPACPGMATAASPINPPCLRAAVFPSSGWSPVPGVLDQSGGLGGGRAWLRRRAPCLHPSLCPLSAAQGFASERDFEEYVKSDNRSGSVLAAVVFKHRFPQSAAPLPLQVSGDKAGEHGRGGGRRCPPRHPLPTVCPRCAPLQVDYELRFKYSPRNAPRSEQTGLNPNLDRDWHTSYLFPLFQLPGPREAKFADGGTPGEGHLSSAAGCCAAEEAGGIFNEQFGSLHRFTEALSF